VCDCKSVKYTT